MSPYIVIICILASTLRSTYAANCACGTGSVNVRSGVGTRHPSLGVLTSGTCIPDLGGRSSGWVNVQFHGSNGWVSGKYVNIQSCSTGGSTGTSTLSNGACPQIVSRREWGARNPTRTSRLARAVKFAFIHHGESGDCSTKKACSAVVRSYQRYHMTNKGWSDIAYSFLIGEDGNAYEGRGWDRIGAHTKGYNSVGLGFCMIGNFMGRVPNPKAINTVKSLIACGVKMGKIRSDYHLRAHRDVGSTSCPGTALYKLVRTWRQYQF